MNAFTDIFIDIGFGNTDRGIGGHLFLLGDINAAQLTIMGGLDVDFFDIQLDADTPTLLSGGDPGTSPGDILTIVGGGDPGAGPCGAGSGRSAGGFGFAPAAVANSLWVWALALLGELGHPVA